MSIKANLASIKSQLKPFSARLIAVTKTHPVSVLEEAYMAGCKVFGENKVQEMVEKYEQLPKDIKWHLIGHLQTNKVKFIAPFVSLIHSIDSLKLLEEVNKQAQKNNRVIDCLLQIYIAQEDTKFGFSAAEAEALIGSNIFAMLKNVRIMGLMGMASNTDDKAQVQQEFRRLKQLFDKLKQQTDLPTNVSLTELSMGMSSDYPIALAEGSTLVRVGSAIFGVRE